MIPESFYVNVNIDYQKPTPLIGTVPMSVLVSSTATETKQYFNLQQVQSDYNEATAPELLAATIYFNNGGTNLLIYKESAENDLATTINNLLSEYSDFIWVTFTKANLTIDNLQTIATTLSSAKQSLPKFLAQTTNIANAPTTLSSQGINNVALLYSDEDTVSPYSAIVIPAYFSDIDLNTTNSLLSMVHTTVQNVKTSNVTSAQLSNLYSGNWNVVINLGNRYTTFDGGKMVDGEPIHSAWGFAIFKRNCENAITDLLVNKLPYQNSSNAVIENVLNNICTTYVNNGLIGTEKKYTYASQTHEYNGINYTTIRQGQVLSDGYVIYSIPISNATQQDKETGKIPPIYIYATINDVIRLVEIIGEVTK